MLDGKEIRKKRNELGLSAQQLADMLQVDKANLYKWEKGHMPSDPTDYIKVENWLNGKVENVPQINEQDPIRQILANLKELRALSIAILTEQEAGQLVVLGSLERLEGKPAGALSGIADKLAESYQEKIMKLQKGM